MPLFALGMAFLNAKRSRCGRSFPTVQFLERIKVKVSSWKMSWPSPTMAVLVSTESASTFRFQFCTVNVSCITVREGTSGYKRGAQAGSTSREGTSGDKRGAQDGGTNWGHKGGQVGRLGAHGRARRETSWGHKLGPQEDVGRQAGGASLGHKGGHVGRQAGGANWGHKLGAQAGGAQGEARRETSCGHKLVEQERQAGSTSWGHKRGHVGRQPGDHRGARLLEIWVGWGPVS